MSLKTKTALNALGKKYDEPLFHKKLKSYDQRQSQITFFGDFNCLDVPRKITAHYNTLHTLILILIGLAISFTSRQ